MNTGMNLTDVLDHMDDKVQGDKATVGNVIDAFGGRGYGPLLLSLALIEILPTGAIPGVPTLVAILVVLVAGQLVAGRSSPWVPQKLRKRGFSEQKFDKTRQKVRPYTQKLDKALKPRLHKLTTPIAERVVGVVCILLAMTMPPLELVPFASSIPSSAIALLGVGLSARDGLIILFGLIMSVASAVGVVYWLVL